MFCTKHRVSIRRLYSVFCTSISVILSKFVVLSFSSKHAFLSFRAKPGRAQSRNLHIVRVKQANNTAMMANRSLCALLGRDDKGLGQDRGGCCAMMTDFSASLEMTEGLIGMTGGLGRDDRFLDFARNDRRAWSR